MFYIVYKTTCILDNMYYIGVHKTKNIEDGYIGSGKYITRAIKKYGKENFSREILFVFDNQKEMFDKETELVTEEVVKDRNNYNCKIGGSANFYYINENKLNHKLDQHLKHPNRCKNDEQYREQFVEKMKIASSFHTLNAKLTKDQRSIAAKKGWDAKKNMGK